ncbi:hypothetical protein F5876DRAFT_65813 [Lentinula aff. lateritia]|uniref:Uncharacterized protein n=1 Tax=Lentinula aff. lateritia TaxID=2804960 RepID=A0ACC1U0X2_9AGAR|nr:hypothetical protein F5876DRAFT_65813 [Lentinula aff. lateritia]
MELQVNLTSFDLPALTRSPATIDGAVFVALERRILLVDPAISSEVVLGQPLSNTNRRKMMKSYKRFCLGFIIFYYFLCHLREYNKGFIDKVGKIDLHRLPLASGNPFAKHPERKPRKRHHTMMDPIDEWGEVEGNGAVDREGCIPFEAYCAIGNGSPSDDYQSEYGANEVDIKVNEDDEDDRKRMYESRLELPGPWKHGFLTESEVVEMSPLDGMVEVAFLFLLLWSTRPFPIGTITVSLGFRIIQNLNDFEYDGEEEEITGFLLDRCLVRRPILPFGHPVSGLELLCHYQKILWQRAGISGLSILFQDFFCDGMRPEPRKSEKSATRYKFRMVSFSNELVEVMRK